MVAITSPRRMVSHVAGFCKYSIAEYFACIGDSLRGAPLRLQVIGRGGPAFPVHALLADEWARLRLHDGAFTDRANRVPLGIEPVGQGWVSESGKVF